LFHSDAIDDALLLAVDHAYFDLTDGLESRLYRLARKHGGHQEGGWSFDLVHRHTKSGSLSPLKHFAYDVRQIVQRRTLPGYLLVLTGVPNGVERLNFASAPIDPFTERLRRRGLAPKSGESL
jgi:plasmid replication initiation protein